MFIHVMLNFGQHCLVLFLKYFLVQGIIEKSSTKSKKHKFQVLTSVEPL